MQSGTQFSGRAMLQLWRQFKEFKNYEFSVWISRFSSNHISVTQRSCIKLKRVDWGLMMTWKQIFGPNFSPEQIELILMVGAFGAILFGIFVLLYLYNQLADDL